MRGIADLYEWFDKVAGLSLDSYLMGGNVVSIEWLERALTDANSLPAMLVPSRLRRNVEDGRSDRTPNPRANNLRVRAWKDFLVWALYPKNYRSGTYAVNDSDGRAFRREARLDLELFLAECRQREPTTGRRSGLPSCEAEAIALAIGPCENGFLPSNPFAVDTRLRNWVMYCTARWGGLRRGELLKLKVTDIPRRIKNPSHGESPYVDYAIRVVRRPDDPDDPRVARRPSVKRGDRSVILPETLLEDLHSYMDQRDKAGVTSDYLFVSESGQPLSVERADDIIKQIGRYGGIAYEQKHPGKSHSLYQLSWHRLRHTRASELLPLFAEAGPRGLDEFLEYFGWASFESAVPYLRNLHLERAGTKIHHFNQRLAAYGQLLEDSE